MRRLHSVIGVKHFTQKETMMPAQMLYDLRAMTGFISGVELSDLFMRILGVGYPSGRVMLSIIALKKDTVGLKALKLLHAPLRASIGNIARHIDI